MTVGGSCRVITPSPAQRAVITLRMTGVCSRVVRLLRVHVVPVAVLGRPDLPGWHRSRRLRFRSEGLLGRSGGWGDRAGGNAGSRGTGVVPVVVLGRPDLSGPGGGGDGGGGALR